MLFDPIRSRQTIDGEIARVLRVEFAQGAPVGNWARSHLQTSIDHGLLVGM